jgi:hypothetical protein
MPDYLFDPTVANMVPILERIAKKYNLELIQSKDGAYLWRGHIREKPELWLTDVEVSVVYNPQSKHTLQIGTPGPYLASEIPHLRKFLEKYQRDMKSKEISTSSLFG